MPPKKDVAAKGVKGKAKAAAKEEKKAQKATKTQGKGKLYNHVQIYITHITYSFYVFILRISELIKRVSEWDSLCENDHSLNIFQLVIFLFALFRPLRVI